MQTALSVPSAVSQLLASFPAPVQTLAYHAREFLLAALPDVVETADVKAKVIGYGYGPGYKDMVATLILSKRSVKIGLAYGASLSDPSALLKGAGKVHRYIEVSAQEQLQQDDVRDLIRAALDSWRQRVQQAAEHVRKGTCSPYRIAVQT